MMFFYSDISLQYHSRHLVMLVIYNRFSIKTNQDVEINGWLMCVLKSYMALHFKIFNEMTLIHYLVTHASSY